MSTPAHILRPLRTGASLLLALAAVVPTWAAGPLAAEPVPYAWPVSGPVLRGFEAPASRFEAGHRGIDIGAPLGTPVRASAAGTVSFAGSVAGSRFVSVDHPDGIRTTYSWLSSIAATRGASVAQGDVIGATGHGHPEVERPHLHFGARIGDEYLDPLVLLGAAAARVHLAPLAPEHDVAAADSAGFGGSAEGLPPRAASRGAHWLWSRTEPKPLVLPGRAGGGRPP